MKIVYDDIIYSLQKSGGGSVYWTEIICPNTDDVEHYVYDNADNNIFYQQIDLKNEHKLSSKYLSLKRLFNPRFGIKVPYIFHSSYFRFSRDKNAINVTTIHDFTVEKFMHGLHAFVHKIQQKRAVKHSAGVICVSENTKKDFYQFYPWYKGKVKCILNGYDNISYYYEPNVKKTKNVLFVGARTAYKRFDVAIELVSSLQDCFLTIVGGGELKPEETALLEEKIPDRYEKMGFVNNHELRKIYNEAFFLCYPSEYEGFGIPLIEAQACGCPVVCQRKSSIPEVVGDTAVYFDSSDMENAVKAVKNLYNEEYYRDLQCKGFDNVLRFSWENSAMRTKEFYEELICDTKVRI